jgi:hypothetical protein
MIASLLRCRLAQAGLHLSIARMMEKLADIREVVLLYPHPPGTEKPFMRALLSDLDPEQQRLLETLHLDRYRTP